MVDYYRTTADGRLADGKGGGPFPFAGRVGTKYDAAATRADEVRAGMLRTYPGLADVRVAATWRGPVGRSVTGLPMFGRMPKAPGVVYGHAYVGNGIGPSYSGAKILASLALERRDEWSTCPLVDAPTPSRLPPEPIRFLGGLAVRAAVKRKDRAEDEGRPPSALDRFLAGFAPSGLTAGRAEAS